MNSVSSAHVEAWLRLCAKAFSEHKEDLTDLDAKIGDADHGAFEVVVEKADGAQHGAIGCASDALGGSETAAFI